MSRTFLYSNVLLLWAAETGNLTVFIDFFLALKKHKVPCSLRELLDLIALLKKGVIFANVDEFYNLAKIVMVKDETYYDKYDRAFAEYFQGIEQIDVFDKILPHTWMP